MQSLASKAPCRRIPRRSERCSSTPSPRQRWRSASKRKQIELDPALLRELADDIGRLTDAIIQLKVS